MVRIYIDCEFNGFGGELMSMALVDEYNRYWYEVLPAPKDIQPWVVENVVPILNKAPITPEAFRSSFWRFMQIYENPIVIADWYTDLHHFLSLFSGRDHSESVSYPCTMQLIMDVAYKSKIPHNALEDARAIKEALS